MSKKRLAMVHGIRPGLIRNSIVLKEMRAAEDVEVIFIWSGQHYSDNMKDIFFRELDIEPPDIELGCGGDTDAETVGSIISKLYPVLMDLKPMACTFLGDTNTTMGCFAAAQAHIPIVHIEGCMRSYDWRMPEEKYRTAADHLSDVIYTYFDEYKQQGIDEGINPDNIVVVQNLIVDVLEEYYYKKKSFYDELASPSFFSGRGLEKGEYYLMTCHRRESVHIRPSFENILGLLAATDRKVYFPASYRTQKVLKEYGLSLPDNVTMVDPIGYQEILALMVNARGVLTDSGTVVEETCVLGVPAMQIRRATERPQVYDCRSNVKFDPSNLEKYPYDVVLNKLEGLVGASWEHGLGDGQASHRVAEDLLWRMRNDAFDGHKPENYHLDIRRSYIEDGL